MSAHRQQSVGTNEQLTFNRSNDHNLKGQMMSTRCHVRIISGKTDIWMYRHHDGYLGETGYNLACCLLNNPSYNTFLKAILDQKYETTEREFGRPLYTFTTGPHGDHEYEYHFEFAPFDSKEVSVTVLARYGTFENFGLGIKSYFSNILTTHDFELTRENITEKLKKLFDAREKLLALAR